VAAGFKGLFEWLGGREAGGLDGMDCLGCLEDAMLAGLARFTGMWGLFGSDGGSNESWICRITWTAPCHSVEVDQAEPDSMLINLIPKRLFFHPFNTSSSKPS
jgi:hypothetical protein